MASEAVTQEQLDEVWEVLDKVETKAFTDKLNWSADLRGRVDSFTYKNNGIGNNIGKPYDKTAPKAERREMAYPQAKEWDPQYSIRGYLNMNAKFEDISFVGRLRFDHSSQGDQRICILSPQDIGHELPSSSTTKATGFDIDRFYFDLPIFRKSLLPLTITGGILPTSGGMSSNIIENTPRRSVFPSLIFDSNAYGGIVTASMSQLTHLDKAYIRVVAGKGYTLNDTMFYYQCNRENIQNMDILGLFAEFQIPMGGINNIFWMGINRNSNIKATPFLGGDGAENKGSNTAIKYQQALGDITNYGLGIEFQKMEVPGGKVDLFAHYAVSDPDGNGKCVNYTDIDNGAYALVANISAPAAIELYPNNPQAHYLYAYSLYLINKIAEARAELAQALSLNKEYSSQFQHLNGLLFAAEGDTYLARQILKSSFENEPSYEYAMDWARIAWQSEHFDEAINAFEQASKTEKGKLEGWPLLNIGRILHKQADFDKAITAYKKAIALFDAKDNSFSRNFLPSPGYVETFYQLGQIYEELGDYKRAKAYYNSAKNSDPDLEAASLALERLENTSP